MKTKLNWVPVPRYHISAAEAWLSKMAAKGLLLQYFWGPFAQFEVGEPKPGRRYRLDVNSNYIDHPDTPKAEMWELYEEFGWNFVVSIWNNIFFVFYSDDPQAVEPFTDEQSRATTLPPLVKLCRNQILAILIWFFLFSCCLSGSYGVLHELSTLPLFLLLFCILRFCAAISEFRSVARLKKLLENGHPLAAYKPSHIQKPLKTVSGILASFIIFFACFTFLFQYRTPTYPLEQIPDDLDLLFLSDMAGPGYLPDAYDKQFIDPTPGHSVVRHSGAANYFTFQWLPLAPRHYVIEQTGKGADGNRLWLSIDWYDMRSDTLAELALLELSSRTDCREIAVPGSDRFLVSEEGNTIYATLGRRVIRVSCFDWMDLNPWYHAIVEMLQAEK